MAHWENRPEENWKKFRFNQPYADLSNPQISLADNVNQVNKRYYYERL